MHNLGQGLTVLILELCWAGWALPGGTGLLQLEHVTQDVVSSARSSNLQWLEDCAVRLLCVLALDRFGDFTSDQVLQCLSATTSRHTQHRNQGCSVALCP